MDDLRTGLDSWFVGFSAHFLFILLVKVIIYQKKKRYAAAISTQSFRERFQKVRALSDPNLRFIPFFGSSEWNSI